MPLNHITFFERFEADIVAKRKTITIRDDSEKDFAVGSVVEVATFEQNRHFCRIKIESVTAISFEQLNERHAQQENMTLPQLRSVIEEIYPGIKQLYVIEFSVATN